MTPGSPARFTSRMILALLTPASSVAPSPATTAAGALLESLAWLTFLGLGIALAVIDARSRRLPNRLVALLTAGGLLFFTSAALVEPNFPALWRALAGLGISFAQLELKLTIARILQRVSFRIPDGTRIDAKVQLTLRPVPGIPMLLGPPGEGFAAGALTGTVADMVRS